MHFQINKYIVPIVEITDIGNKLWGTGFIVNNHLISAAHVFNANNPLYFLFNGELILLDNLIYREYEKGKNIRRDLLVYKICNIESPLILHKGLYPWKTFLDFEGFSEDEDNNSLKADSFKVFIKEHAYENNEIRLDNCFETTPQGFHCNSGCPIMMDNVVYGMNIAGYDLYNIGIAIRSDYISSIIEKLDINN